ncbi:MAG: response regulator [Saprospiraceae bacterium]|nr:response regulator [Saprospiraceae bacterium]
MLRLLACFLIFFGDITASIGQEIPTITAFGTADNLTRINYSDPGQIGVLLQVVAPWWKSSWLALVGLIGMLGLSVLLYRSYIKGQLQQKEISRLQALNDYKNRLYINLIHEFRTPLTVIQGMAEGIRGHEKETKIIQSNNTDLLNLVNQVLELQEIEAGKVEPNMVQGDIIFYLRYILESFSPVAGDHGVELHFLNQENELVMDFDKEKILRIISNLLSNAIKFTPEGGNVYLTINTQQNKLQDVESTAADGAVLLIGVKDTGIGIPPERLPHLFDRFYQVPSDGSGYQDRDRVKGEGTGIGLALTKELVKILKGKIDIESKEGAGTSFSLKLPIARQAAKVKKEEIAELKVPNVSPAVFVKEEPLPEQEEATLEDDSMPSLLLIEDNPDIVTFVSALLEEDYRVSTATDGQIGIEKAFKLSPDIIISDIMMPKKDGFEVCEALKNDERTSHIPIILLTGKIDVDSRMAGLKRGADAYLTKPFHQEELFIRLEQLLALRQRLQQRYQSVDTKFPPSTEPTVQQEDIFMIKVRKTIEKRMKDKNFSTPELSKALGMSRSHLHLKIKALTNQPTSHYIRLIRLQKAKELLETTDHKISDIAAKVGFSRPTYFTRLFTERYGKSPRQFR